MATWLRLVATGLLGASLAIGCKITEADDEPFDDDDTEAGEGGEAGRASAGRAGAGTAGRAGAGGSSGGRAGAGSGGTGGSRAGAGGSSAGNGNGTPADVSCDDPMSTEPAPSCEFMDVLPADEPCLSCLSDNCCSELKDCYATEPSNVCGYGVAPDGQEEYYCYMDCLVDIARASDTKSYTTDDMETCAFECGMPVDGSGEACALPLISNETNELLSCMHNDCEQQCLLDRIDAP